MRLVQVMVPAGKRETVLSTLDGEEIDYVLSDETSGREYTAVVSFPLPTEAVEPVLAELRDAGLERDAYTVVLNAETVVSKRFEKLEERYAEDENGNGDRIAREELEARATEMSPRLGAFVTMTVISTVVATAGLLLDSAAVVVGSMVIAPLIGPAMAASVGTVLDNDELFARGVKLQAFGAVLGVASAAVFAAILRYGRVVPFGVEEVFSIAEVRERLAPDVLSLPIALGSGVAGALSLASGVSSALVGVMIAAALVPPTAVVGIGIAWGRPGTVAGAALLVVVNFVAINFAALATLWYKGYRPESFWRLDEARATTIRRVGVLGVAILLSTAVLAGVTVASYESAQFESAAHEEADALLSGDAYVLDVAVTYGGFPFRQPTAVTVTVGHPPDAPPPGIAAELSRALDDEAGAPLGLGEPATVDVSVRYVAVEDARVGSDGA
ncbi:TIGR00341 family protein [Halobaculum sp. CBA1158]|uniref:TIGR00341 family protein n=1 Tax=Halobaculum sp. CBA1158 TaxID=2904243 RepID=UPI001F21A345|nr:TIGR00341 family protein [Halobaculum sp. CBA1158]UIP00030.1 TIGR00341 family protein [Halobaculum sp. CBA1158]